MRKGRISKAQNNHVRDFSLVLERLIKYDERPLRMAEGDEDDDGGDGGGSDSGDVGGFGENQCHENQLVAMGLRLVKYLPFSLTAYSCILCSREKERDGALKSIACETIPSPRSCRQSCWQGSFNKQTDRRNKVRMYIRTLVCIYLQMIRWVQIWYRVRTENGSVFLEHKGYPYKRVFASETRSFGQISVKFSICFCVDAVGG